MSNRAYRVVGRRTDPARRYVSTLPPRESQAAARRLARVAESLGVESHYFTPHELGAEGIAGVRDKMLNQRSSPSAVNNVLETLQAVTRVGFELGCVSKDELVAVEAVPGVPDTEPQQRLLSNRELSAVVSACLWERTVKGVRDAAILLTVYAGGLNARELVGLGTDAWQGEKSLLKIREEGDRGGRPVPLGKDASDVLRKWLFARGPRPGRLFLPLDDADRARRDRLSSGAVKGILDRWAVQAEVDRFSCKDLRRTAAADMIRAGAAPREISRILGAPVPRVPAEDHGDTRGAKLQAVVLDSEHLDYFDVIGYSDMRYAGTWGVSEEVGRESHWIDTVRSRTVARLGNRLHTSAGQIAYGRIGQGPPVVLVHGSMGRATSWRRVASALARCHTVYACDLLGHGESEYREQQDLGSAAQARLLSEMVEKWGIGEYGQAPDIAGEGTGAAIVLRAYLREGMPVRRMALLNPAVFTPWVTEADRHVQDHPDAYLSMPEKLFESALLVRAKEEIWAYTGSVSEELFVSQWQEDQGRIAYVARAKALDEEHTEGELESLLDSIKAPTLILSGESHIDAPSSPTARLQSEIPGVRLGRITGADRLASEQEPDSVAHALYQFFRYPPDPTSCSLA